DRSRVKQGGGGLVLGGGGGRCRRRRGGGLAGARLLHGRPAPGQGEEVAAAAETHLTAGGTGSARLSHPSVGEGQRSREPSGPGGSGGSLVPRRSQGTGLRVALPRRAG